MKKIYKLLMSVVAVAGTLACTTDATEDLGVKVGGKTQLTLSLDGTRTQLGTKDEVKNIYPLTWSEGDQISVNGVASEPLATEDGAGTANATFTFGGTLQTPYFVAYPAAENTNQVVFPAEQNYSEYSAIEDGVTVMYGYSANGENIRLNYLNGILKIAFKGTATLTEARISTIDRKPIAGTFNAAYDAATESVTLTPVEGATSDVITYSFGSGVILSEDSETYIHVAVPAGLYEELYLTLEDSEGKIMYATVKAGSDKPLAAGKVREFSPAVEYVGVSESDSEFFILSDQMSLMNFKTALEEAEATLVKADATDEQKAAATATLQKNAVMVNDIEVREVMDLEHKAINAPNYTGEFNGNGYAIIFDKSFTDDKKLTEPLFDSVAATIKGVHLKGVYITNYNSANTGALANTYLGTSISHCSSAGKIALTRSTDILNRIGGLVGYLPALTANSVVSDCVNNCAIDVTLSQAASDEKTTAIAGIIGDAYCTAKGKALTVSNCVNNATIDVDGNIGYTCAVAGILSRFFYVDLVLDNCKNTNNVSINLGKSQYTFVGGIYAHLNTVASAAKGFTFDANDCSNSGDITLTLTDTNTGTDPSCVGGCFGIVEHSYQTNTTITNCDNSGDVVVHANTTLNNKLYVGGVAGRVFGRTNCDGCDNSGKNVTVNVDTATSYMTIGGIVGYSGARASSDKNNTAANICYLTNSTNSADVALNVKTQGKAQAFVGGVLGLTISYADSNGTFKFDNLKNYGDVILNSKDWVVPSSYATPVSPLVFLGGIIASNWLNDSNCTDAYVCPFHLTNCVSGKADGSNKIKITGDKYYSACAGGIIGFNTFSIVTCFKIDGCTNNMAIEHDSATESANLLYCGGIIGITAHIDTDNDTCIYNSTNNGAFNINAKSAADVNVGGIIGTQKTYSTKVMGVVMENVVNNGAINIGSANGGFACTNLWAGGLIGQMESYKNNATKADNLYQLKSVINTGDVSVLNVTPSTSHYIGGAVGNITRPLMNIQSHCTVTVNGDLKAGLFAGQPSTILSHADADGKVLNYTFTDCKIGGTLVEGTTSTTPEATNLTKYLFSDRVLESLDGITLLASKAAIEYPTAAEE